MEIKSFAEQLLYGTTLDDKLISPAVTLTDLQPGSGIPSPKCPGRPDALRLDKWDTGKKVPFPSLDKLSDGHTRGQVLHFFANHELLAIELMALALLKFPEAPASFRRGLIDTILDEQAHMRLYAEHMQKMCVDFGEIPVNDFFWTCLSPMTSPLDFVAHMSLTFEQANLDFSLHYSKAFRKVGDEAGADLLKKVFHDEIGHVKHGLVWLNRWKEAEHSDWDAYTRALRFPITPNRAKGLSFVADLRRDIGFSEEYISELSVFTHTKGRPPQVLLYNPNIESSAAGLSQSQAELKVAAQIENDFSSLMMFLGRHDDLVLVSQKPSQHFLLSLKKLGISVPEFATYKIDGPLKKIDLDFAFEHKNLGALVPWARSHELQAIFLKLPFLTAAAREELLAQGFKKEWYAKSYLHELVPHITGALSRKLHTVAEANAAIAESFEKYKHVVVKAPYSSSGRHRLLLDSAVDVALQPWLTKTIAKQGAVIVEPWLEKICDLSFQFVVRSDCKTIDVVGWTRFLTDARGQYLGTMLGRPFEGVAPEVKKIFYHPGPHSLESWQAAALEAVQCYAKDGYSGPIGVDAFLYRNKTQNGHHDDGSVCLRPVVEVNTRFTMGRIALEISKIVLPGQFAVWMLIRTQDVLKHFESLADFTNVVTKRWPSEAKGNHVRQGIVFTTDPLQAQLFLSLVCVGREVFDEFALETGVCEKQTWGLRKASML